MDKHNLPVQPVLTQSQLAAINALALQNPEVLGVLTNPSPALPPLATQFAPISTTTASKNIPAFLNKLYNMVSAPECSEYIYWTESGTSFCVVKTDEFSKEILPKYFKHSNFSSFVRQLNMYDFHKVPKLQSSDQEEQWEFANPNFQRDHPDLLCLVTRKKGKQDDEKEDIEISHLLNEMSAIKRHQQQISTEIANFQNENQLLWQESIVMRDKYQKQQETIDKIIKFIASVFANKNILESKKRLLLPEGPLKITDEPPSKRSKSIESMNRFQEMQLQAQDLSTNIELLDDHLTCITDSLGLEKNDFDKLSDLNVDELLSTSDSANREALFAVMDGSLGRDKHVDQPSAAVEDFDVEAFLKI